MKPDPQQSALARAMAQYGTAGEQQVKQQQQQSTGAAGKQQALDAASSRAGLIGAPADFLKQSAQTVAQPYDNAAATRGANDATNSKYMGAIQGATGNYTSQLQGSLPLIQGELNKQAQSMNLNQMLQLYNLTRQQKQDELANQSDQESIDLGNAQQEVINKLASSTNKGLQKVVGNIIATNTSESLPEALAYLNSEGGQQDMKDNGLDQNEVQALVTQYYSPKAYTALLGARSARAAAAPPATSGASAAATAGATGGVAGALSNFLKKSFGSVGGF